MVRHGVVRMTLAVLAGVTLGIGAAWMTNTWLHLTLPAPFDVTSDTARTLLTTMLAAMFTLAAFSFWMRTIAVNLVAGAVPARVLREYLDDRFQANLMVGTAGAVAFISATIVALPERADDVVPMLGVVIAVLLSVVGLGALLFSMTSGLRAVDPSRLIRSIAERAMRELRAHHDTPSGDASVPDRKPDLLLTADNTGWMAGLDVEAALTKLPDDAVMALDVGPGDFVIQGTRVGRVWSGRVDEVAVAGLPECVRLASLRADVDDDVLAIDLLVDVASRAMGAQDRDMTLAIEVIGYMGLLLATALEAAGDQAPVHTRDRRRIVMASELSKAQLLRRAFHPLRMMGARWPEIAGQLLVTLAALHDRQLELDHPEAARQLRRLASLTVDECRSGTATEGDKRHVERQAVALGLLDEDDLRDRVD